MTKGAAARTLRSLMVLGTGSGVGKSLIVTGLLRIFSDMGFDAAPFKAQNMALNCFITRDGGEIGRAQALQAEAARVEASTDMNPILLKATGDAGCQVIADGRSIGNMTAREYYAYGVEAWRIVTSAYQRLAGKHELIVMEGAGSPSEINLMDKDIVNMGMAKHAGAPALLVGDIEKGGVFASLYGTFLLQGADSGLIRGFIINKFRGDMDILTPGLHMLAEKTGMPCLGVLPYMKHSLSEEDSLSLSEASRGFSPGGKALRIVVVRNRFISNFTDFEPLALEPDVEVIYSLRPREIEGADLVIIPGSKNTSRDLLFLRQSGVEASIKEAVKKSVPLIGMCGGFQMLGHAIKDPFGVESEFKEIKGMGLLDIETVLEDPKVTTQVEVIEAAQAEAGQVKDTEAGRAEKTKKVKITGYEVHMGRSTGDIGLFKLKRLATGEAVLDGSRKAGVWGTYIHGLFDNDAFRGRLLNGLRARAGLPEREKPVNYSAIKEEGINALADAIRDNLDMRYIESLIKRCTE